jgi:hypothetical protein
MNFYVRRERLMSLYKFEHYNIAQLQIKINFR